jgi:Response regulator consisting of a CheY-like receiver domain and a Fis-type HTH domain
MELIDLLERKTEEIGVDKTLLLVDDDEPFLRRLTKAMEKRGFKVESAGSVKAGRAIATARPPAGGVFATSETTG